MIERPIINRRPVEYQLELELSIKVTFKNLMF